MVEDVLDFSFRVSSREAYVSPSRGAQGNALKTLVAMPFVLDGDTGRVEIDARGVRHKITFAVDPIRQQPVIRHERRAGLVKTGCRVTVRWPHSASTLRNGEGLDHQRIAKLLSAIRAGSRPVKAAQLGIIGEAHLRQLFECLGCLMDTFEYKRVVAECDGFGSLPWVSRLVSATARTTTMKGACSSLA